jgi:hypothetical protein
LLSTFLASFVALNGVPAAKNASGLRNFRACQEINAHSGG